MATRSRGTEAVTAPLGVMLLTAVVVILAFATFFFAKRLTDESGVDEPRPELAFSFDEGGPRITVVRATDGLDWVGDLVLSGTCDPTLNGAAFPTTVGQEVTSGDVLECEPGERLVISSSGKQGNTSLFDYTFPG